MSQDHDRPPRGSSWRIMTRKPHEQILLSGGITITVQHITVGQPAHITLRIEAPHEVLIVPAEQWTRRPKRQEGRP